MVSTQRREKDTGETVVVRRRGAGSQAKKRADRNKRRREIYSSDVGEEERNRDRARKAYRDKHPKTSKPPGVLVQLPEVKEVYRETDPDKVVSLEVYTVPAAAEALGKTQLTLKHWINDELVPGPILLDTVFGYRHYSSGELKIIFTILKEHWRTYDYLTPNFTTVIHQIAQNVEAYRKNYY